MADATLYCKTCKEYREHMHLAGRDCICSECGEKNAAPNWREIVAAVEARKAGNVAAVSRNNGGSDPELEQVARLPYSERGFREPSNNRKPKENTMKAKLSDEKIAEIRADYAALTEEERTPAAREQLASKHGVSMPTFKKYVALMETKAKRGRKGGRVFVDESIGEFRL